MVLHVILTDDRQTRAGSPGRILPAVSASMASHAALLLCLALVFPETRQRESTAADLPATTQLVWMPGGNGGGGGGNQDSEPARRLHRTGACPGGVLVRAIVQADATVRDIRVIRSLDPVFGLDQAAVLAASQWLFRPALMAGQPVALAITIELVFSLR